jgi:putative ABC transport system permease protein
MFDSMARGFDLTFHRAQRYDLRADFFTAQPTARVQRQVGSVRGVRTMEMLISLPVQLQHGDRTYDTVLQGLPSPSPLLAVLDAGGHVLQPRADAAVLSRSVATSLHLAAGDTVRVRMLPHGRSVTVQIGGLSDELLGNALTLAAPVAARDFGLGDGITTVLVTTKPGQLQQVHVSLGQLADVDHVTDQHMTEAQIRGLLGLFNGFIGVMLLFGAALAVAILFNTASISVLERRRELATMRALGQRMGRLAWLVTVENGLLAIGGLVLGFPVALACLWAFLRLYSSDLFSLPFWLAPRTLVLAVLGVLLIVQIAQAPALRAVARMNIAEAAKARE